MKFKQKLLILSAIVITALIIIAGCTAPPTTETSIIIAGGDSVTNDSTPTLTISATGAVYMAFSGNETTWSSWVAYATSYSSFNITTGAGCTAADGTKTVYVKFKNAAGTEFGQCLDSITYETYDTTGPKLLTAVYSDDKGKGSGTVNAGDVITFTFDDEMDTSTVTSSNLSTRLVLSSGTYGSSPAVSWSSSEKVCEVTLGTSPTVASGATVNPSASVTDVAGNADISTAVTITGFTSSVFASVTISPASKSYTEGDTSTTTFTAVAINGSGTNITSLCTFAWTESGIGTISSATGSSTVYTPASGTGTNPIQVSAVYSGVTRTATATVTISAAATTDADPDKLFVSAKKQQAKYTPLPAGATVKVYSHTTNDATAAQTAGVKVTISSSDTWTSASIDTTDYIFFTMTNSSAWTSPITADGQIPTAPDATALGNIKATSKSTVTSSAGGNVVSNDKITLYVGGIAYSAATAVGSNMTVTPDLVAGNQPTYTRTNPDGHESVLSAADGKILILNTALGANVGTAQTLNQNDTLTLTFWDGTTSTNVDVKELITVSNISWVATGTATLGTGTLRDTATNLTTVVLTATSTCKDFDTGETVTFNILPTTPILDYVGGNQVLPLATDEEFDTDDF
jgi:hypothetical protein